jgi:hypothetical protein
MENTKQEPPLSPEEQAVFDVLWALAGAARLEAVTSQGTRYAVTGDIVRDMARAAVAAVIGIMDGK